MGTDEVARRYANGQDPPGVVLLGALRRCARRMVKLQHYADLLVVSWDANPRDYAGMRVAVESFRVMLKETTATGGRTAGWRQRKRDAEREDGYFRAGDIVGTIYSAIRYGWRR